MHRQIPIYRAEAEAGLSEAIQAKENLSIAAFCPILMDKRVISEVREKTRSKDNWIVGL